MLNVRVCECACDAYLKHLQFDDENKPWHISMENFLAPHANLQQGRAPACLCVCVHTQAWVRVCACCCGGSRQLFRFRLTLLVPRRHQFKHDSQGHRQRAIFLLTTSFLSCSLPLSSYHSISFRRHFSASLELISNLTAQHSLLPSRISPNELLHLKRWSDLIPLHSVMYHL